MKCTLIFSVSNIDGPDAVILSFPIFPDARSPRANADAIFPAPIKPTDDILRDMTSIKFCIDDVSVMIVIFCF